jgi:hypothetical protein
LIVNVLAPSLSISLSEMPKPLIPPGPLYKHSRLNLIIKFKNR